MRSSTFINPDPDVLIARVIEFEHIGRVIGKVQRELTSAFEPNRPLVDETFVARACEHDNMLARARQFEFRGASTMSLGVALGDDLRAIRTDLSGGWF